MKMPRGPEILRNPWKTERKSAHIKRGTRSLKYDLKRLLGNTMVPLGFLQVQKQQMRWWARETKALGISWGTPFRTSKQWSLPPPPRVKQHDYLLLGWNHQHEYLDQRGRKVPWMTADTQEAQENKTYCIPNLIILSQCTPTMESKTATTDRRFQALRMI